MLIVLMMVLAAGPLPDARTQTRKLADKQRLHTLKDRVRFAYASVT